MTGLAPRPSGRRRAAALAGAALAWLLIITAEGACSSQPPAGTVFPDPRVTPLAEAVAKDDTAAIARLAKEGADVNARGEAGVTLLQWALLTGNRRSLTALLDAGADPARPADEDGRTVVHYAAMLRDTGLLKLLLAKGVDPNMPNTITKERPIVSAMMSEREASFDLLLKSGVDLTLTDRTDNTPLHAAAKINAFREVRLLLEAGAPPLARNRRQTTFQRYLFMTPEKMLSGDSKRQIRAIKSWLTAHGIAIEPEPGPGK